MQCRSVPYYTVLYIYILSNARTISWHAVLNCALLDCSILDDTCTIQYTKNIHARILHCALRFYTVLYCARLTYLCFFFVVFFRRSPRQFQSQAVLQSVRYQQSCKQSARRLLTLPCFRLGGALHKVEY